MKIYVSGCRLFTNFTKCLSSASKASWMIGLKFWPIMHTDALYFLTCALTIIVYGDQFSKFIGCSFLSLLVSRILLPVSGCSLDCATMRPSRRYGTGFSNYHAV